MPQYQELNVLILLFCICDGLQKLSIFMVLLLLISHPIYCNLIHLSLKGISFTLFSLIKTIKRKGILIYYFLYIKIIIVPMINIMILHSALLLVLSSALGLIVGLLLAY